MKFKNLDIIAIIYIFLMYWSFSTENQGVLPVTYNTKYYIGVVICVLLFIMCVATKKKFTRDQVKLAGVWLSPMIFAAGYTVVLLTFSSSEPLPGYYTRFAGTVSYAVLVTLQAFMVYSYFGKRAIRYTFISLILCYLTSMVIALKESGITEFILMLTDSSYVGSVLEMHEVAPIAAMFLIYYLFEMRFLNISRKGGIYSLIVCLIIIFFSHKRIVILSLLLMLPIYFHLVKMKGNPIKKIKFYSVFFIVISYFYVFMIESGLMDQLIARYDINSMTRQEIWAGLAVVYEFSITFMGNGLGYASKWMDLNYQSLNIIGLTQTTGIHNDILKLYIELGFIGMGLYLIRLLYLNTIWLLKKTNEQKALVYFVLMLFQVLIWFTDNVSVFHNYQFVLCLITFTLLGDNKTIDRGKKVAF